MEVLQRVVLRVDADHAHERKEAEGHKKAIGLAFPDLLHNALMGGYGLAPRQLLKALNQCLVVDVDERLSVATEHLQLQAGVQEVIDVEA